MPTADSAFGVDFDFYLIYLKLNERMALASVLHWITFFCSIQNDTSGGIEVSVRSVTRNRMSESSKVIQNVDRHQP